MIVEISEKAISIIAFGIAVAAIVVSLGVVYALNQNKAETTREIDRLVREARQVQIQVMDQNALLIREGLKQPTDTTYGPAGNLEYKPKGK